MEPRDLARLAVRRRGAWRSEGRRLLALLPGKRDGLAFCLGITRQGFGRLLSGQSRPSWELAARIEAEFRIPIASWAYAPKAPVDKCSSTTTSPSVTLDSSKPHHAA
jgi:DNA-binding XRE family transcriptional regulator